MTYDLAARFAQTSGLLYFVALFAGVALYAVWPRNQGRFDAAARLPLDEE
ncbi:cytochrome C oxidase [Methylobacterium indicum]|uniref:Cytochrome C oxidase n=1 Tax=Methylobacterium indicum TaxID=1775910 RepID=A0ABR5GVQ1_9HYPH|nr:cbb3-type cytochrome c oxidase subunit 3 [Methylobacterium indicum]KMO13445.1 cytochrome C oxidase [Methylobacterium indicum]KMO13881.1 cytochrome C oxidase [Methylobacterium indicum]KTS31036.1 cytochrome C oxidase [Methylobacterium indicum]KTS38893.1 cytochrome C oxidase [Methylobacterium indicum]KTS54747.1 cytochrome C oxidase [Methylobacterium indicum]